MAARRKVRGKKLADDSRQAQPVPWPRALLANALIVAPLALAWWLQSGDEQSYYLTTQEDGWVEWATFWAFLLVLPLSVAAARHLRRTAGIVPWFPLGVGLFCAFVAMEEISWGQRLLGYRPPDYFLAENFQQELNFHNVVDTSYRKLALMAVILGYGVLLPLAAAMGPLRRLMRGPGVIAPSAVLAPAFLVVFGVYSSYPWKHTGEWVELALGLGFLAAPLLAPAGPWWADRPLATRLALPTAWSAALILGCLTAVGYQQLVRPDPTRIREAERELGALRDDFASGLAETHCNLHKRLYTYMVEFGQSSLLDGDFGALTGRGLPPERADYLLDPWNSPYWLRDRCVGDRRLAFVYSFGPNRRRDSTRTEVLGDDIGAFFVGGPLDTGTLSGD